MMNNNHIFVDTNVLIGAWIGQPADSRCLEYLFSLTGKQLYISTLSVAQFVAVFQDRKKNAEIKKMVEYFLSKFHLVSFTEKDVEAALKETEHDIEDNIQFVLCRKVKCQHVITNNIKDYRKYNILNILPPEQCRKVNQ